MGRTVVFQSSSPRPIHVRYKDGTVVMSSMFTTNYYVALLGHSFGGVYKKDTIVLVSTDIIRSVSMYNSKHAGSRDIRAVAPNWRLRDAMGPFLRYDTAAAAAREIVDTTRGFESKRRRLHELAARYHTRSYSDAVKPQGGFIKYIKKHAPLAFTRIALRVFDDDDDDDDDSDDDDDE